MTTKYVGNNKYRYRYFKSPPNKTKFLLDVFIDKQTGFINIVEHNLPKDIADEKIELFAQKEIKRIQNLK